MPPSRCRNVDVVTTATRRWPRRGPPTRWRRATCPRALPPGAHDIREAYDGRLATGWAIFSFPAGERDHLTALLEPSEFSLDGQSCDVPGRIEWWPVLLRNRSNARADQTTGLATYEAESGDVLYAVNWNQGRAYLWTAHAP